MANYLIPLKGTAHARQTVETPVRFAHSPRVDDHAQRVGKRGARWRSTLGTRPQSARAHNPCHLLIGPGYRTAFPGSHAAIEESYTLRSGRQYGARIPGSASSLSDRHGLRRIIALDTARPDPGRRSVLAHKCRHCRPVAGILLLSLLCRRSRLRGTVRVDEDAGLSDAPFRVPPPNLIGMR